MGTGFGAAVTPREILWVVRLGILPMLCEEPQFMAEYPYTRLPLLLNDERARGNVLANAVGSLGGLRTREIPQKATDIARK